MTMKKQFQIVTILSIFLLTPQIRAEINMKDASYRSSIKDSKEILRTYNSRSLYSGYFGFGWCSNLEKSLTIINNKEVALKDCDKDSPFVLMDENNFLKTRAFINSLTKEKILFKSGIYTQYAASGEIRIFNRRGQLIEIIKETGEKTTLEYLGDLLIRLKNNTGQTFHFFFNDTNQITKIESTANISSIYVYEKENLIQSLNFQKQSTLYEYDSLNNMIRITYPNKSEESIAYNNDQDRVLKIQLPNNCTEYYDFYTRNNDPLYQVSTLTRKCDNRTVHQYMYEFWYKQTSDGTRYLERYKVKQNTQTLDITYQPLDGTPIRIIKNGKDLINKI
jgi:hypothetical protein